MDPWFLSDIPACQHSGGKVILSALDHRDLDGQREGEAARVGAKAAAEDPAVAEMLGAHCPGGPSPL